MPDLSSSPKPWATMRSYCFFVAAAKGSLRPWALPSLRSMPESLAAWAAEKKQAWSRFCMSSPSVLSTCELAPVWERTSRNIDRSSPRAWRSEEHTSELQSLTNLVCRLLFEEKKKKKFLFCRDQYLRPRRRAQYLVECG